MRKAESNVRIEHKDGTSTLFAPLNRGGSIMQKDGVSFEWNDEQAMHCTVKRINPRLAALDELAAEVFEGGRLLTCTEFTQAIIAARNFAEKTAQKRVAELTHEGIVRKAGGAKYAYAPKATPYPPGTLSQPSGECITLYPPAPSL
jgi:hypothetical protein